MIYYMAQGTYSDYGIIGVYEGPEQAFDMVELVKEFKTTRTPKQSTDDYGDKLYWDDKEFQEWLIEKYQLKKLDAQELMMPMWIGDWINTNDKGLMAGRVDGDTTDKAAYGIS